MGFLVTPVVTAAISAGVSYLLAPSGPDIEGPRVQNRNAARNAYGDSLALIYGTMITTGSLTWMLNNELTETKTTERQGGKGGGGGQKVTTYSYSMTGTNAVCDGPVNGINRVWADTTLIYDLNADDISGGTSYDFEFSLGANGQPQGSDESGEKGAASTPAYRGTALHFIDDMELADYGNRVPNFQYEVAGLFSYDLDSGPTDLSIEKVGDLTREYSFADPSTNSDVYQGVGLKVVGETLRFAQPNRQAIDDIRKYESTYKTQTGLVTPPQLAQVPVGDVSGMFADFAMGGYEVKQVTFPNNGSRYALLQFGFGIDAHAWFDTALLQPIHSPLDDDPYSSRVGGANGGPLKPRSFNIATSVAETENYLWCFDWTATGEPIYLCCYGKVAAGPYPIKVWDLTSYLSGATGDPEALQMDGSYDQRHVAISLRPGSTHPRDVVVFSEALIFGGNPDLITLQAGTATPYQLKYNSRRNWFLSFDDTHVYIFDALSGEEVFYDSFSNVGVVSNGTLKFALWWISPNSFTDGYAVYRVVENPILDGDANASEPGADLQNVVEDLCFRAGLKASDVDASALSGTRVRGYSIKAVQSLRESLEPLMLAYHFEPYEEDYKLKFAFKDKSSSLTVTEDDMRAHLMGTDGGQFIEIEQIEESKLPRRVNINYLNFNADYEPDTQFTERSSDATTSKHISEVSLEGLSLIPSESVQLSDKLLREAWISRASYKFSLPKKYSYLTPTDVITLNTEDYTVEARVSELALGVDGRMEITAVAHDQAVYTSARSTEDPINSASGYPKAINAQIFNYLIDTNLLDFSIGVPDGSFPIYLAAWSSNFKGYQLQQSSDGETWDDVGEAQLNKATIGYVTSVAGAPPDSLLDTFDVVETLGVRFFEEPDISSATDVQVFGGQNVFAVGQEGRWEVLGAATVTQVDSLNYTLSRLFRGLKGTEGNVSTMQEGDAVILLNPQTIGQVPISSDKIGSTYQYRALYGTGILDEDDVKSITHTGNPLKEYAPTHITGRRNGSNDLIISWERRTRISGEWRDNVDAFLAVNSRPEEYKVVIKDGSTTLRTITGITSKTTTYTDAQQTTDSAPANVTVEVTQVSTDGDGYTGTALL